MIEKAVLSRPYEYVAFVDEAGDPGLRRIESSGVGGASEWFVLGCALFRRSTEEKLAELNVEMRKHLGITQRDFIHYKDLHTGKRNRICSFIADKPNILFAVCSHKKNMEGYNNERAARKSQDQNWFYNFIARILFERVSDFVYKDSIKTYGEAKKIKIVFASRGVQRFSTFGAYLELLRVQTRGNSLKLGRRKIVPTVLDGMLVSSETAKNSPGLQIADIVASAFFDAVNESGGKACNASFALALEPRMAFERRNNLKRIADYGLVMLPTGLAQQKISNSQKVVFQHYGYPI